MEILIGIVVVALVIMCGVLGFVVWGVRDHGRH
jgi:nitrogen fixation-related uncharacterized protein